MFGLSFLVSRTVGWAAETITGDKEFAETARQVTKYGMIILTLDIFGEVVDNLVESIAEETAEGLMDEASGHAVEAGVVGISAYGFDTDTAVDHSCRPGGKLKFSGGISQEPIYLEGDNYAYKPEDLIHNSTTDTYTTSLSDYHNGIGKKRV